MKSIGVIGTTALLLLLGVTAPANAQQEQQANPEKQEHQAKPEKKQQQAKSDKQQRQQGQEQAKSAKQEQQQQAKGQQEQQRQQSQQQAKSAKQEQQQQASRSSQQAQHGKEGEQRVAWQQPRAHSWQSEHRTWQQRGGYNGYRIPNDRYRGYFGQDHWFRIYSLPVLVVGGYPRFQYGGYWVSVVDPWPEYWSDNWYDNDDVYIAYFDDGYYPYNRSHPGARIALSIYLM